MSKYYNFTSQRGSFLILFMFSIIIFLSILGTISASGFYLKQKTQTLSNCRSNLISIQDNMKLNLTSLMALNAKAKFLRVSKKSTQIALKKAIELGQIKLVAALKAILKSIKIAQKILRAKQQAFLASAYSFSLTKLALLKSNISSSVNIKKFPFDKKLAVRKVDPASLTPSYYPDYNFTNKQKIEIVWEEDPIKKFPRFLKKIFKNIPLVRQGCGASLKEEGVGWKSILI